VGGRHDHFLTPESHLHVASLIPGAPPVTGHSPFYGEPHRYNEVVSDFFAQHPWQ
jgi:pimeloyl-ACP methyl ester carboxylesterase